MQDRGTTLAASHMMLLPWYATGRLLPPQTRRIDQALKRDAKLARQLVTVREERAATVALNESLGAPSPKALLTLLAAIDATPSEISR